MGNRKTPEDIGSWKNKPQGERRSAKLSPRDYRPQNPTNSNWGPQPLRLSDLPEKYLPENSIPSNIPKLNGAPQPYIKAISEKLDERYIFKSEKYRGTTIEALRARLEQIAETQDKEHLMKTLHTYEQAALKLELPEEESPTWQAIMIIRAYSNKP